jgi:hypothetical protein
VLRTPTALRGERHIASKWPRLASLARVFLFVPLTSKLDGLQTKSPAYFRRRGHCLRYAEREGFEPSVRLPAHTLSKRAPSATRTPLQCRLPLNAPVGLLFLAFGAGVVKFHASMRSWRFRRISHFVGTEHSRSPKSSRR